MNPFEIAWRVQQSYILKKNTKKYKNSNNLKKNHFFISEYIYILNEKYMLFKIKNKRNFLLSELKLFTNYQIEIVNGSINWFANYQHNNHSSLIETGNIPYDDGEFQEEQRVVWEVNRLNLLIQMAASNSYNSSNIREGLEDWIGRNPYYAGINWKSAMEAAIRNINLIILLINIDENDSLFLEEITKAININFDFVENHYSRFSSANNHLLVELISNEIVSLVYTGKSINFERIEKEIKRQTHADGVNREQAVHYHSFVLEAILLWKYFSNRNDIQISDDIEVLIYRMIEYIRDLMTINALIPEIGDSDEGRIICFTEDNQFLFCLELGSVLMGVDFTHGLEVDNTVTSKTFIFPLSTQNMKKYTEKEFTNYSIGEKFIWRSKRNKSVFMLTNGEFSLPPLYAHAHADNLSVYLFVEGNEVIVDGGTYFYNRNNEMRNSYRMPDHHSNLSTKNDDFSDVLGAFMWSDGIYHSASISGNIVRCEIETVKHSRFCRTVTPSINGYKLEDTSNKDIFFQNFILAPNIHPRIDKNLIILEMNNHILATISPGKGQVCIEESWIGRNFVEKIETKKVKIINFNKENTIEIKIEGGKND